MRAPLSCAGVAAIFVIALCVVPSAAAESEAGPGEVRWELAPIRWRGLLAADWRSFAAEGEPRRGQQVQSAALQASSYVYQPWFAQLAVGVNGLVSSEHGAASGHSSSVGGNAMLSVFPTSRFPFQANFERADSRSSEHFTGQEYRTDRFGVRQTYRSALGAAVSIASYDRSALRSPIFGRDILDVWSASHSRAIGAHSVEGNASRTRNSRPASGDFSESSRLFARHGFAAEGLNLETLASYGENEQRLSSGATPIGLRSDALQLNSFATWRPEEDHPLHLTGGARYFESGTSDAATSTEARSLMGHLAGNYRASANLVLNGGASATQNSGAAGNALLTTQFAGASYSPDARRWGPYLYTSNLGANIANQTGAESGAQQLVSGQASHGVQRLLELSPAQSLALNVSQNLAVSEDSEAGGLRTLSHHAGASWRLARGASLSGFAAASASDSRTSGTSELNFQLVNLQLSGQAQISRFASLGANYTVQGTRQETATSPAHGFNVSRNGGATYQHLRAFGVPGLRYTAAYERSDFQLTSRAQGDLDAPPEQVAWSFEQRLEYRIGKLDARFSARFAEIDGRENALLFFRLARQIGDW